jgi:hypothetical protein
VSYIARAQRGTLFHITSRQEGGRTYWLCGSSTKAVDPKGVSELPDRGYFGELYGAKVCATCVHRHNRRIANLQTDRDRRLTELELLVRRSVVETFAGSSNANVTAEHAFALRDELTREGHGRSVQALFTESDGAHR